MAKADQRPPDFIAQRFATLMAFVRSGSAGGMALILAGMVALLWSNSPLSGSYFALLDMPVALHVGSVGLSQDLQSWVNDGLMALFFLLVGLEIRREMTEGHLASLPRIAAPGIAALGGMAVPALIYTAFNWTHGAAMRGWAVPVATDIAFSLAALSVLGRRVPVALKVFLTALAIMDDLGAIVVIALFYAGDLALGALAAAALIWLALFGLARAGVRALSPYMIGGIALWLAVLHSGIHATLAGVALAFVVPMGEREGEAAAPARRLEAGLDAWVAFGVLPLFGVCNAGLRLDALSAGVLHSRVVLGIVLGLVIGKQVGVFVTVMVARALGVARLPAQLTVPQLYGGAILCGIGFTMSLFIGDLAFHGHAVEDEAKLAVLCGSVISALYGIAVLTVATRRRAAALTAADRHD